MGDGNRYDSRRAREARWWHSVGLDVAARYHAGCGIASLASPTSTGNKGNSATDGDYHIRGLCRCGLGQSKRQHDDLLSAMASIGSQSRAACRELGRSRRRLGPVGCASARRRQPTSLAALAPVKSRRCCGGCEPTALHRCRAAWRRRSKSFRSRPRARNKAWNTAVGPADLTHRWTSEALHRRGAGFGLECLAWCRACRPERPFGSVRVVAPFRDSLDARREQHEPGRWQRRPAVSAMVGRRVAADHGLLVSGNRADAPPGANGAAVCLPRASRGCR